MRKILLPLASVIALTLAGCNAPSSSNAAGGPTDAGSSAAAKTANEVSGTLSVRGPGQVSSKAVLVLNLVDVSSSAAGSAPLATKTAPAGTFPQSFKLTFNPAQVKAADLYVVKAILTDGDRHYSMPIQAPVLNRSPHDGVKIELVAEQTAGEKVQAKFDAERKMLGGMKMAHGTKLEPDASRGWQVFRKDKNVAFIRELVDYGKKGFTSTDYAYQDGKAWAIEQTTKPSQDGKATGVDLALWDDSGDLVLKQQKAGSDTTPLDDDGIAKLKQQAQAILALAKSTK